MDAVEFLKAKNQMCKAYYRCDGCPLSKSASCAVWCQKSPKEAVVIVEKWLEAHPPKTRQSEFLKQYPNARLIDGVGAICPKTIDISVSCPIRDGIDCPHCRRKFWMQEVE